MRYLRLGKSDLEVSRIGLDCHTLGVAQRDRGWDPSSYDGEVFAMRTIHAALDAGINIFDTSSETGGARAELLLGKALHGRRSKALLASRLCASEDATGIEQSVTATLRRLRADHLDILYVSDRSVSVGAGKDQPRDDRLAVIERLQDSGTVGHLGLMVSNPEQAEPLIRSGLFDVVEMQCDVTQRGAAAQALDTCNANDVGVGIMKPLGSRTLKTLVSALDPEWSGSAAVRECCLKYLLSDRRIQLINLAMRWEHEVITNSRLVAALEPAWIPPERATMQVAW